MGDIAIDQIRFTREECSLFPSSAAPHGPSDSRVGEFICSCYADRGGDCGCCFDFGLCAGFSVFITVKTTAARDDHRP